MLDLYAAPPCPAPALTLLIKATSVLLGSMRPYAKSWIFTELQSAGTSKEYSTYRVLDGLPPLWKTYINIMIVSR